MTGITVGDLRQLVRDTRFSDDRPVFIRIVDQTKTDERTGAYQAVELPIQGGLTGWADGHATILALGSLDQISDPG